MTSTDMHNAMQNNCVYESGSAFESSDDEDDSEYAAYLQELDDEITRQRDEDQSSTQRTAALDRREDSFVGVTRLYEQKERWKLEKYIDDCKQQYRRTLDAFSDAQSRTDASRERLEGARRNLKCERDERMYYKTSDDIQFRGRKHLHMLEERVLAAEQQVETAELEYQEENVAYRQLEERVLYLRSVLEDNHSQFEMTIQNEKSMDFEKNRRRAKLRQKGLDRLEQKKLKRELEQQDELMLLQKQHVDKLSSLIENGKTQRKVAAARLKKTVERDHAAAQLGMEVTQREKERRDRSAKELMKSVQRINRSLQSEVEKTKKRQALLEKRERELIQDVVDAGGNPFEILRRRKELAKVEAEREAKLKEIVQREKEIGQRIAAEMEAEEREMVQRKVREEELRRQENMVGVRAQDERLRNYIRERNKDGAELIDPLNKETKLYPSKIIPRPGYDETLREYNPNEQRTLPNNVKSFETRQIKLDDDELSDEEFMNDDYQFKLYPLWDME